MIRHDRRDPYKASRPTATLAAEKTPIEEKTTPTVATVEAVETVPSVIEKPTIPPAPLTISRQRRMGAGQAAAPRVAYRTREARARHLQEEATQKVVPFVTDKGTVDVVKMSTELGPKEASRLLSQIGVNTTAEELQYALNCNDVSAYVTPQEYYVVAAPKQQGIPGPAALAHRGAGVKGPTSKEVSAKEYEDLKKSYEEANAKYESAKKDLAAFSARLKDAREKRTFIGSSTQTVGSRLRASINSLDEDRKSLERQIATIEAGKKLTRDVIDIPRMATDLGDTKAAELLTATGSYFTPKVVEMIRTGAKIVPGTGGALGAARRQAGLAIEPTGEQAASKSNTVYASSLSVTDIALLSKLNGLTGGEAIFYIRQLRGEDKSATLAREAVAAASEVNPGLKGWLDEQIADMNAVIAAADTEYEKHAADYEATSRSSTEEAKGRMLRTIIMRYYPEWSDQYNTAKLQSAACFAAAVKASAEEEAARWTAISAGKVPFEQLTAGEIKSLVPRDTRMAYGGTKENYNYWLNQQASLALESLVKQTQMMQPIPGAEVTEIAIDATPEELATAQAELDAGLNCRSVVNTYKVTLVNGDIILVQALTGGTQDTGPAAAIAKARAAGYDAVFAHRKYSWETVHNPSRLPTIDIEYCTVMSAKGNSSKFAVPLNASDDLILEIANAYGLPGGPSSFQITGRETGQITAARASEMLFNAEQSSGRLYGLTYMTVSTALDPSLAISPGSIPVRSGDANTDVKFLDPATADEFRKTVTYQHTPGTDMQKVNEAYQEYLNAPRIEMPGGWSMLARSIKDTLGNILIYGFDALTPNRQAEINSKIEKAASGDTTTPPADTGTETGAGGEKEAATPPAETGAETGAKVPDMSPPKSCAGGCCAVSETFRVAVGNDVWVLNAPSREQALIILGLQGQNVTVERVFLHNPSPYAKPVKIGGPEGFVAEPMPDGQAGALEYAQFEKNLLLGPAFLRNAYIMGGISGYNAALEVYNDTVTTAGMLYEEDGTLKDSAQASPYLSTLANSTEFQKKYTEVLQPAGMSSTEYAQISPYIKPGGIEMSAAFQAGIPGHSFDKFVLSNSSQEFRDAVESGEVVLLPYGMAISKKTFDSYPSSCQKTLLEGGYPLLEQQEKINKEANIAQGLWQNMQDKLVLASHGLVYDLRGFVVAEMSGMTKTDYKAGDLNPVFLSQFYATHTTNTFDSNLAKGDMFPLTVEEPRSAEDLSVLAELAEHARSWGSSGGLSWKYLTAQQADALNTENLKTRQRWYDTEDAMGRAESNWQAEHPMLQPVFPQGPLQAFKDDPRNLLNPLVYGETIMGTLPYTLATLGVSVVGSLVAGPAGVALTAPFVFGITWGSEGHQIYRDALANGASRDQARHLMNVYGAISAAIETIGDSAMASTLGVGAKLIYNAIGRRFAENVIREAATKYGWAKLTGSIVLQFLNQAGQEAGQQMAANAAIRTFKEERPLFEGVMDAFIGGLIGTAPFILIPSVGQAIRIGKGGTVTAADVRKDLESARFKPSDQRAIVNKALLPVMQLVEAIGSTATGRKAAALYSRIGQLALHYVANAAELMQVRESLVTLKSAEQLVDQQTVDRLQARVQELTEEMTAESSDLKSVSQDLVDLLGSLQTLDKLALEAIQGLPGDMTTYLDQLVSQTMKGEQARGPKGVGRQQAYKVNTFAKTVDDARTAVNAIHGIPTGTKLALRIAVNDMTYALARLGEAIQAAPGMGRKAVLDAAADLELTVKKVYDLLKSLPEMSKVKLLQTVNEIVSFAASARFAASEAARIVGNDLEYAFTTLDSTLKATPGIVREKVTDALTGVDIALKKASDTLNDMSDAATRELSEIIANVNLTAKDVQTYVEMYGRVVAGEVAYKAGLAREAAEAVPGEVAAAGRRLGRAARRKAGEGVLLTRMAAQVVVNDIEFAVQTMLQAIKDAPDQAARAVAAALSSIKASLASARLTAVMSIQVAYNELSYATQRLVDAIQATPGIVNAKAKAAVNEVVLAVNKLADQARHLATAVGDIKSLAVGELAYYTNQLLEAIGSVPQVTRQAVLDAAAAVDRKVIELRKQLRGMPAAVVRYVNSVAELSRAVKAAVQNKVDFSILSAELAIYKLEDQARQIRDVIESSPAKARAVVADALLTARTKIKQIPGNIEYRARNYMSDLKRDIYRAEVNRLNKAYFSVGENVRNAVKSQFDNVISGRGKLEGKEYGPILSGLTDLMTALLRAVQGTEFEDVVKEAVGKTTYAVFSGDPEKAKQAGMDLEGLLATVPGFGKKKGVPPKMRDTQQLARDGGSYLRTNADDIVKAVEYLVIVEDIQGTETWENTQYKLENFRDLLKGEIVRIQEKQQEEQTLSDFLNQVNWETGASEEQRGAPPILSYKEQLRQNMIQDRIRKMLEPWGQGAAMFYRDLASSSKSIREQARERFQQWMEDMYGRDYMSGLEEEVDGQLKGMELGEEGEAGPKGKWAPGAGANRAEEVTGKAPSVSETPGVGEEKQAEKRQSEPTGRREVPKEEAMLIEQMPKEGVAAPFYEVDATGQYWKLVARPGGFIRGVVDVDELQSHNPGAHLRVGGIVSLSSGEDAILTRYNTNAATGENPTWEYILAKGVEKVKVAEEEVWDYKEVLKPGYEHDTVTGKYYISDYLADVQAHIAEVERILRENKDKPPDAPPPSSVKEMKPPEPKPKPGASVTRVAVQEKVEAKPEVEELTETEKEALEKAKEEQATKELTEDEKKSLEEAKKRKLAELAEEAARKEEERKGARKLRPGPAVSPSAVIRAVSKKMIQLKPGAEVKEMPGVEPMTQPKPVTEIEPAVETGTVQEVKEALETGLAIQPTTAEELAVQAETGVQPQVQTRTQVQPAVQTQVQTQVQAQTAPQTQVQPAVQVQAQEQTQTQTQTQTETQTQVQPQVQVALKIPPLWKLPSVTALAEAYRKGIPILIWRQGKLKSGEVWKAVIDPQRQTGLITVIGTANLPVRPEKLASGPGSAAKTLQWLGNGPRHKGSADLGIVDVYWGRKGGELKFVGKGLKTDVGMRMPSPTVGISLETEQGTGGPIGAAPRKPVKSRKNRTGGIIKEVTPEMEPIESISVVQNPGMLGNPPEEPALETGIKGEKVLESFKEPIAEAGVEGEGEKVLESSEETAEPVPVKTRTGVSKKVPRRKKLSYDDYMTTLKGFSPYTFRGA